jgi:transglutaminase-like putative cysteine protease
MMEPAWKQLGEDFAFASDRFILAQIDTFTHRYYNGIYKLSKYPTLLYFDGYNETPVRYQEGDIPEYEPMAQFLEENTGVSRSDAPSDATPSINMGSKPSLAQVKAVQSRPLTPPPDTGGCLICRDFSEPDQVASEYPRESLPQGDQVAYLADALCRPFRSPTDKARAIFRWLAYNIAYDTAAFFGGNVKHVDPRDTIRTGLAVCGGYAGLFVAIGRRAGLDCEMVTGHGKGFGYKPLKPGERVPPCKPDGHAWNAVRIDGGEWKLLDACWGAGNVTEGSQTFNKVFKASYFTMSNDQFGIKHFPQERKFFFREDGTVPTWEEYFIGPVGAEPLQVYGSVEEHGISEIAFEPSQKRISANSDEMVRFQFSKICEHWDHERNGVGSPYCMILRVNGPGGEKKDFIPFDHDDYWWWLDIPASDLGVPGQNIGVMAVTTINNSDARGVTKRDYLEKKGRCAMGFGGVCGWDLV